MLTIEKKRTDKIDWIKPLQKYISTQYSEDASKEHTEALNTLQQLREDCRNASDKSDAVKDILYRYYWTLSQVEIRFPVSEDNVRISFPWINSFGGKKIALFSLHYERSCALFNYAVVLSQLGAMQNRNAADGIKLAAGYFQSAAGAFSELKEYVAKHPGCSASNDLSSECLSMLVSLHLGQAQNCFLEKAGKDGMKDAILAKLAAQALEYYETATTLLNGPLKSTIDRGFAANVEMWTFIHKATCQHKLANVAAETMKYGEQVSRLAVADNLLNEARKRLTRSTPIDLKDTLDRISTIVGKALYSAQKDNDTIYNAIVPPESRLEQAEKKSLVKPTPLAAPPSVADLFTKLVPYATKQAASNYKETKEELVHKELRTMDENNDIAKGTLSSLNLPGAIEALDTPTGIPPTLAQKMEKVKKENGPSVITDLMEALRRLAEEDVSILSKAMDMLDKEEQEDNKLRAQYGASKWSRTPSHTLTPSLRQEAAKYKGYVDHAVKSDAFVAAKWRDHSPAVNLLAGPPGPVIAMIGSGTTTASSADSRPLKKVLSELDALIAAREAAKTELQTLSAKDDIVMKLLNSPGMSHEQVFGEELRKYDPIHAKLRENYAKQEMLLASLAGEHKKFEAAHNADTAAQAVREQREQALTKLASAFTVYNEVKAGVREGMNFYTNLQELLQAFASKCSDFVLARDTEKADLQQANQAPPPQPPSQPPSQPPPPYGAAPPAYPSNTWQATPALYGSFSPAGQAPQLYAQTAFPVAPPGYQPQYAPPPYGYQQPPPPYRK